MTSNKTDSLSAFAASFYQQRQRLFLQLQDEHALDVLLLLAACWLGQRGTPVTSVEWAGLLQRHQPWQQQVVSPLRAVRRALREWPQAEALREQVKASELAAEWAQLARLEQWLAPVVSGEGETMALQLQACCRAQGVSPPSDLLRQFIR